MSARPPPLRRPPADVASPDRRVLGDEFRRCDRARASAAATDVRGRWRTDKASAAGHRQPTHIPSIPAPPAAAVRTARAARQGPDQNTISSRRRRLWPAYRARSGGPRGSARHGVPGSGGGGTALLRSGAQRGLAIPSQASVRLTPPREPARGSAVLPGDGQLQRPHRRC